MTLKSNSLYLHIGIHKTASTFLQTQFFSRLCDQEFFEKNDFIYNPPRLMELIESYLKGNIVNVDEIIQTYYLERRCGRILISSEGFCMHPFDLDWEFKCRKLKELFPAAIIILFIRNQIDWLESLYCQVAHSGRFLPAVDDFLNYRDSEFQASRDGIIRSVDVNKVNFSNLIGLYYDEFSSKNVHVFFYEDFKSRPDLILKRLELVLGVHRTGEIGVSNIVHRSYSVRAMRLVRFLSKKGIVIKATIEKPMRYLDIWKEDLFSIKNFGVIPIVVINKIYRLVRFKRHIWFRWFVQNFFDRFFGYEKYRFTGSMRKILEDKFQSDNTELRRLLGRVPYDGLNSDSD